ncbi:hypothetical protein CWK15_18120 [Salmonella enterica]|uniref:DUF551 domain-containing protein n=1 Tax=Salmonella enterica TaxID=28901 RepID=A0A5V4Z6K1_SALER|nr:hypothetical protein [Salmonella enterica]EIU1710395.1 hypothetical protein [Salmonella enterica]
MTTITKERIELFIKNPLENGLTRGEQMELALIALASLDAEPAGYHVIKEYGKVGCSVATLEEAEKTRDFWNKKWTIRPYFYTAPPVQETGVYNDVLNIIGLLENNEWAEHCMSTVLGSLLESEITRLVGKEQPVPVVPEEMPKGLAGQIVSLLAHNIGDKFLAQKIWNACRNAMLNGDTFRENPISSTNNFREIAETSTNSPVIPDCSFSGLVNSARALLDALYEFGADEVDISEYVTNLEDALRVAAAPEPEGLLKRNIREIEHIMDSCRATMLQANQRDLSQPVDPQVTKYEQIMLQAGWVMMPVEPTDEMIAAAMECEGVIFDSKDPTAFCVQYREIYCAMVDTAPKQETGPCTK